MNEATQTAAPSARRCGAMVLAKVLQRYGRHVSVETLWSQAAMADPFGTQGTRSYRLAAIASGFGLDAAVVQCDPRRSWDALRHCSRHGLTVILNHQTPWARGEGHYSRLASIGDQSLILDDPLRGLQIRVNRDDFLLWWRPNAEAGGFILIAVTEPEPTSAFHSPNQNRCPNQQASHCPRCRTELSFTPQALFHPPDWAPGGLWIRFFCHGCDAGFSPANSS